MKQRLEFHDLLASVFIRIGKWLWDPFEFGNKTIQDAIAEYAGDHVYFQPPATVKMAFPCIVYSLEDIDVKHADNRKYNSKKCYTVTVIDKNPDSVIPEYVSDLPYSSFSRHYTANNMHHFSFRIYY